MATTILTTKLYVPPPRPNVVHRPRLIERLNEGLHHNLTLISAPAGFGKTTLISAWVTGLARPAAWLSLDEEEKTPTRFLTYLIAALQTIAAPLGAEALSLLQASQPPPPEAILTALLNEITTLPDPFVLVLDDYHMVDANAVDVALTYLVERLPPRMHLVIATREDPHLPLSRLRARGRLTELRAADLRFTPSEAAVFLTQVMGLSLSAADIAHLSDRTEGWIAGLQLAALSLRGHQDVPGFIRAFAGDHRYLADYLVEEVLQRQSQPARNFLLQTAILDQLSGPLCDAVTGQQESSARLGPWNAATSFSCRSMTRATGIAITTSLAMCSMRVCWRSSLNKSRRCISARAYGSSSMVTWPMRSAMRWPPRTSSVRRI
jgi:LuxR family maltose regulon positive regulatory protein